MDPVELQSTSRTHQDMIYSLGRRNYEQLFVMSCEGCMVISVFNPFENATEVDRIGAVIGGDVIVLYLYGPWSDWLSRTMRVHRVKSVVAFKTSSGICQLTFFSP